MVYWPLRVALTGQEKSPDPVDVLNVIGKEKTLKRIEKAIKSFNALREVINKKLSKEEKDKNGKSK